MGRMYVYAGIDEAGYGPLLGPMTIGRTVFVLPDDASSPSGPPDLWQKLQRTVCRRLAGRKGRLAINDSKKLTTKAAGIKYLEQGCLSFASLAGHQADSVDAWLSVLGETCHQDLTSLPWYAPCADRPWETLPVTHSADERRIDRAMLIKDAQAHNITLADLGVAVVLEDRFNQMVTATRSKAAVNFTFVASHLQHIWEHFAMHHAHVAVDRQGGRISYRDLLQLNFPKAQLTVLGQSPTRSAYRLTQNDRTMTVTFQPHAETAHMPTALASMLAKYTRELMMARFNAYFCARVTGLAPTAGYATDAKRWLTQMQPHWSVLGHDPAQVRRLA